MKTILSVIIAAACLGTACAEDAAATREVKTGALTLNVPATWTQQEPMSPMRALQFALPAADGDKEAGELIVYFFGEGQGGGVKDNIDRWVGQFAAEGRGVEKESGDSTNGKVSLVKITGTYNKSVGPMFMRKTTPVPGSKMLAAVVETGKGNYFVKAAGPEKTMTGSEANFKRAIGMK